MQVNGRKSYTHSSSRNLGNYNEEDTLLAPFFSHPFLGLLRVTATWQAHREVAPVRHGMANTAAATNLQPRAESQSRIQRQFRTPEGRVPAGPPLMVTVARGTVLLLQEAWDSA